MAEAPSAGIEPRRLAALATALLCVALPALRPLVWDGDAGGPANLALLALLLGACALGALEALAGWRRAWRAGPGAAVLAALTAWLALAAWRAPDPAAGAALWVQLALHGLFAAWLLQVAPGRERLLLAGLLAGLGAEAALALLQRAWVLPAIAAANQAGSAGVAMEGVPAQDFADRVAYGGLFGTFTLSNTLAAFLILLLPPLAAAAWRSRGTARAAGLAVALAAALALAGTASKGAWLALAAAGGIAWLAWVPGWRRWLPIPLALAGAAALLLAPGLRAGLAASAEVRLGYWQGAWRLAAEEPWLGQGIGAFAERSAAVMPLWAEPSRLVHNEVLEAAVSAGIPGALLLAVLLALLACGRTRPAEAGPPPAELPAAGAALATGLLAAYLGLLGAFDGQFGWYPGGGGLGGTLAWGAALGLLAGLLAALGLRLAPPAGRWWRLGLGALALHSLIDFDLHAAALWGVMAVCAALASPARERPLPRAGALAAGLAWIAVALLVLVWGAAANEARTADDGLKLLRLARVGDAAQRQEALAALAAARGEGPPADAAAGEDLWRRCWGELAAGADARRRLPLLALLPPSGERLAALQALRAELPGGALLEELLAADLVRAGRWEEAYAAQAAAVAQAPAHLPTQRRLAALCDQASAALPSSAEAWRRRAEAVRARLGELAPVVHPRNR